MFDLVEAAVQILVSNFLCANSLSHTDISWGSLHYIEREIMTPSDLDLGLEWRPF